MPFGIMYFGLFVIVLVVVGMFLLQIMLLAFFFSCSILPPSV